MLRQDALDEGLLQAVDGFDVGLARREHVRVKERLPQPDERVAERVRLDDRDQAEFRDVAARKPDVETVNRLQQALIEGILP